MNPIIWLVLLALCSISILLYFYVARKKWNSEAIDINKNNEKPYYLRRYAETDTRGFRSFYYAISFGIAILSLSIVLIIANVVSDFRWKWLTADDEYEDIETVEVHLLPPPTLPEPPPPKNDAPAQKTPAPTPPKAAPPPKTTPTDIAPINDPWQTTTKPTNSDQASNNNTSTPNETSNNNETTEDTTANTTIEKDTTAWKSTYLTKFPSYPGGKVAMRAYIDQNITYPPTLREAAWEGVVRISAEVLETGYWGEIFVSNKNVPAAAAKEAKRILTIMPRWEPAEQEGKAVKCLITIPIRFEIIPNAQ